ncbi:DMT family transporter [Paludifilum halophilum]|uniref:DMT family transporter n=1 Tax=Paludifilum halophilum TaxID=1642702 RepID=UPI001F0A53A0|nr:DMT family transporter [Paludifilum halophilum]
MTNHLTYVLLTVNMMIWGLNTVAIKVLVEHFPPLTMQSMRIFFAGCLVSSILYLRREWKPMALRDWKWIFGAMIFGVVGHHSFLATGLSLTTATNGAIILALVPLTTTLLSFLLLKDRLTWLRSVGIALGFTGVALVVLNGGESLQQSATGDLYMFGAMFSQALSFIFIKKATDTLDAKQVTAVMFSIGSFCIFLLSLLLHPAEAGALADGSPGVWAILLSSAVIATGLGHMFYNSAIPRLGTGQTAIFINLTPFFALVGAVIFLGESMVWTQAAGFLFIVAGVFLGTGALDHKRPSIESGAWKSSRKGTDI